MEFKIYIEMIISCTISFFFDQLVPLCPSSNLLSVQYLYVYPVVFEYPHRKRRKSCNLINFQVLRIICFNCIKLMYCIVLYCIVMYIFVFTIVNNIFNTLHFNQMIHSKLNHCFVFISLWIRTILTRI